MAGRPWRAGTAARPLVSWPLDEAKLARVRALMEASELDALVVRAPDNVLYLTNFWGMKGYDACVFPRQGEPVLLCLEASLDDAARTAWTSDVRLVRGYDETDPRPPPVRTLELAVETARPYGRVAIELSLGTQASDRMVGEPTTFTKGWFDGWPDASDAGAVLTAARAIKTEQEIERMRLANEICAAAMEHVRERAPAGDDVRARPRRSGSGSSTARAPAGTARSSSRSGSPSSGRARGSARSRRPATGRSRATSRRCSRSGSAPTGTGPTTRSFRLPG